MGKIKEYLLNNYLVGITPTAENLAENQHLIEEALLYESWKSSEDYINMINEELVDETPSYSKNEISSAILYAIDSITIDAGEIGNVVYGKLLHEKVFEYLNQQN